MQTVTNGAPKELLKLGRKTVLQRVIDEALDAEVDSIIVVNSPSKPEISEAVADQKGVSVVVQPEPLGAAHALACAGVEDDALVLLGDCVYHGGSPCPRMHNLIRMGVDGCIAVEQVSDAQVRNYGIVEVNDFGSIKRILEKPETSQTTSRWAVAARYAFSIRFMSFLAAYVDTHIAHRESEINLTEVIVAAISEGYDIKAVALQGSQTRVDCGSPKEYDDARRLSWD